MSRVQKRKTPWRTKLVDRVAGWLITLGGIGTIGGVGGVCVFLVWVVLPLFAGGKLRLISTAVLTNASVPVDKATSGHEAVSRQTAFDHAADNNRPSPPEENAGLTADQGLTDNEPLTVGLDDTLTVIWAVNRTGELSVRRLLGGDVLLRKLLPSHGQPRCAAVDPRSGYVAFGYDDGQVQFMRINISVNTIQREDLPEDVRKQFTSGVSKLADNRQGTCWFLQSQVTYRLDICVEEEPVFAVSDQSVERLDFSLRAETRNLAALTADKVLHIGKTEKKLNFLTGEETTIFKGGKLNLEKLGLGTIPDFLRIAGVADSTYLIWKDGRALRLDTRDLSNLQIGEELFMLSPGEGEITTVSFLIGKTTLIVGSTAGTFSAWFPIKPAEPRTPDGVHLIKAHNYRPGRSKVSAIGISHRSRIFAAVFADGLIRVYHATTGQLVAEAMARALASSTDPDTSRPAPSSPGSGGPVLVSPVWVAVAPKDNGVAVLNGQHVELWELEAPHAGMTWQAVFGKVWYEGHEKPAFVWQSSGGTDDFEPKYSLIPLIFGTIKATAYAMLFAAPLAFLAAVYSSEILHRDARNLVKPTIELMAGLPSVVLGFLAALVFAPWVESRLPQVLTMLYVVPFALLLGGHLTNVCPNAWQGVIRRYRVWFSLMALSVGIVLAQWIGPTMERWFFAGDIKAWLDGRVGRGEAGWGLALLPLMTVVVTWMTTRWVEPTVSRFKNGLSRTAWGILKLVLFLLGTLAAISLAWAIGWLLVSLLGLDPRGLFLGTYIQRNAFIVGFVMGFAVIPIIYTIADDALSAVPDHLRAASLGAGATPWQTAIRIVIPTAMSGLFSAFMIGLGRAAGETMIVLMAAGNTPIMDWNIFNGFRTLSANIAVELPEAVQYSTHYRMLFLAALCLFVITFVVNTLAEVVRIRFRKKAYQL
ncbi:MAG: ABC transporter permease subunit [Thermogutta sp.]